MVTVDRDRCNGCGECVAVCPHAALSLEGNSPRAVLTAAERCMECGACGLNCPEAAITGNFGVACFACMTQQALSGKPSSRCACAC
jgi:NAD-dependent dihydropyrimidine dehydrogenase PreA subunit